MRCYKCNKLGHFARDCKMEGDRCYNCNKIGHIAKDCDKEIDEGKLPLLLVLESRSVMMKVSYLYS